MTGLGTLKGQRFFCLEKDVRVPLLCVHMFFIYKSCIQIVEGKYQLQFFLGVTVTLFLLKSRFEVATWGTY